MVFRYMAFTNLIIRDIIPLTRTGRILGDGSALSALSDLASLEDLDLEGCTLTNRSVQTRRSVCVCLHIGSTGNVSGTCRCVILRVYLFLQFPSIASLRSDCLAHLLGHAPALQRLNCANILRVGGDALADALVTGCPALRAFRPYRELRSASYLLPSLLPPPSPLPPFTHSLSIYSQGAGTG